MASDDTMTINSSMYEGEDEDDDADDDEDQPLRRYSMSRLSICTSNSKQSMDDDVDDDMMVYMSRLYGENESEVEADEKEGKEASIGTDDSDKEATGWFSLPESLYRGIRRGGREYKSENDEKGGERKKWRKESRKLREKWLERTWEKRKCKAMDEEVENNSSSNNPSGESECVVLATPKGGRRSLCMDMEEVKACRDLGFDFQHEWTVEIPHVRISSSTADTDSGGNSPIANWRISSPGDDPKDVKARLKVWAQAVALASTSRLNA